MVSFSARSFLSPPPFPENILRSNPRKPPNHIFTPTFKNPNPQKKSSTSLSCLATTQHKTRPATIQTVSQKVRTLDSEFKSLPDPIDRVKRLLHYAAIAPRFDESRRTHENRVSGCAAQVWLEVAMDRDGLMRFGVDSDSEIAKGFCACLVWALDGAEAREVLGVTTEDLVEMNVGVAGRVRSRFNAWHNVLVSMQRRTRDLVEEKWRREKVMF